MAGKGRPPVDDKRDNQYRVRLNDEENQMLSYCSEMTGQPKSQIFVGLWNHTFKQLD